MTDPQNRPEVYANKPMGARKAHLFQGEDVRNATLVGGVTDDSVKSVCGLVHSYGDFTTDIPDDVCENCASKTDSTHTDD